VEHFGNTETVPANPNPNPNPNPHPNPHLHRYPHRVDAAHAHAPEMMLAPCTPSRPVPLHTLAHPSRPLTHPRHTLDTPLQYTRRTPPTQVPVYYVMFTVCTIAISNILYKDFRYEDRRYTTQASNPRLGPPVYMPHTGLEP